jgi:hypothetical protein
MAKKKVKKKSSKSKKSDSRKTRANQPAQKRKTAKKPAKKKAIQKKAEPKKKRTARATEGKTDRGNEKVRKGQRQARPAFSRGSARVQSGDLQGISNAESADSESVDELLEEGNSFEAGIISGVEGSRERGGKEVRTREVPEDDVPGEYLDED